MSNVLGTVTIKKGDTLPPLRMQISDKVHGVVTPRSIVGATVTVYVTGITVPFSGSSLAFMINPLIGTIRYEWGAERLTPGFYQMEVGVTGIGQPQRYPKNGYVELRVLENLS